MSNKKSLVSLQRQAEAQGWVVTRRRNGHLAWRNPAGDVVYSSSTPSDYSAIRAHLGLLVRYGFDASEVSL